MLSISWSAVPESPSLRQDVAWGGRDEPAGEAAAQDHRRGGTDSYSLFLKPPLVTSFQVDDIILKTVLDQGDDESRFGEYAEEYAEVGRPRPSQGHCADSGGLGRSRSTSIPSQADE